MPVFKVSIENKIIMNQRLDIIFDATGNVDVSIDIIDVLGNTIHTEQIILKKGINELCIQLNSIATGTYYIRFFSDFNLPITEYIIIAK
jgi:hypothetical protein